MDHNSSLNILQGTATGTGVGTIRRFLISVGAIVITVGFVGVSLQVEVADRNDRERFGTAEQVDVNTSVSSVSAISETGKTWSLDDGALGSRVRGTIGRLTGFDFVSRRVRLDSPVRRYKTREQESKVTSYHQLSAVQLTIYIKLHFIFLFFLIYYFFKIQRPGTTHSSHIKFQIQAICSSGQILSRKIALLISRPSCLLMITTTIRQSTTQSREYDTVSPH